MQQMNEMGLSIVSTMSVADTERYHVPFTCTSESLYAKKRKGKESNQNGIIFNPLVQKDEVGQNTKYNAQNGIKYKNLYSTEVNQKN